MGSEMVPAILGFVAGIFALFIGPIFKDWMDYRKQRRELKPQLEVDLAACLSAMERFDTAYEKEQRVDPFLLKSVADAVVRLTMYRDKAYILGSDRIGQVEAFCASIVHPVNHLSLLHELSLDRADRDYASTRIREHIQPLRQARVKGEQLLIQLKQDPKNVSRS